MHVIEKKLHYTVRTQWQWTQMRLQINGRQIHASGNDDDRTFCERTSLVVGTMSCSSWTADTQETHLQSSATAYRPRNALYTHTHPFNGHLSRTTRVSRYQKGKPIWISLKQETVSGSGIRWAICKSAPSSSQITTPVPHHSIFYRPDALPAAQPTASKHWRHNVSQNPVNCRHQLYNKSTTDRSNGVLELQLTEL